MLRQAVGFVFVVGCATAVYQFLAWAGLPFTLGVGAGVVVYQVGHYCAHGRWIDF